MKYRLESVTMMRWWNRHWYEVGIIPAAIALVVLIATWSETSVLTKIGIINFIGIMVHQFEEYGFPGGTPYFMNKYMRGGNERYPLNPFSAMVVNVVIGYVCYLLPVFFPNMIWLGMAPILFGCVFQAFMHIGVFFLKFHRFYNPGVGAVLCIHVPCGIYYICYLASNHLITGRDWIYTAIYLVGMIVFTGIVGQVLFSSKDSKYAFDRKEILDGEKFARRMGL